MVGVAQRQCEDDRLADLLDNRGGQLIGVL
jgi:hypothetical protein